jgi:hypothetical protein
MSGLAQAMADRSTETQRERAWEGEGERPRGPGIWREVGKVAKGRGGVQCTARGTQTGRRVSGVWARDGTEGCMSRRHGVGDRETERERGPEERLSMRATHGSIHTCACWAGWHNHHLSDVNVHLWVARRGRGRSRGRGWRWGRGRGRGRGCLWDELRSAWPAACREHGRRGCRADHPGVC